MRQDPRELVIEFMAKLRGQAAVCAYTTPVPNCADANCNRPAFDYSLLMVRDALLDGLYNPDIQEEVLGNANQNMMLEQAVTLISNKEAGKRSQSSLQNPGTANSASTRWQGTPTRKCSVHPKITHTKEQCYTQHRELMKFCKTCDKKHLGKCFLVCKDCDKRHMEG
jgi:hypothetical protein